MLRAIIGIGSLLVAASALAAANNKINRISDRNRIVDAEIAQLLAILDTGDRYDHGKYSDNDPKTNPDLNK